MNVLSGSIVAHYNINMSTMGWSGILKMSA